MKYLVTDAKDIPLAVVDGKAGVQQTIERQLNKDCIHNDDIDKGEEFYCCLEDFRIYEIGLKAIPTMKLEFIADKNEK